LDTSRDGDSTTSLGSLFQCLTTLSVKTFYCAHFAHLPQLRRATPPASLWLQAASSCQGTAATFQHPGRKMPAMTIWAGNSSIQLLSSMPAGHPGCAEPAGK